MLNAALFTTTRLIVPALKSFSGEHNDVEQVTDNAEEAHRGNGAPVDHVTYDVMTPLGIASICGVSFRHLRSRHDTAHENLGSRESHR